MYLADSCLLQMHANHLVPPHRVPSIVSTFEKSRPYFRSLKSVRFKNELTTHLSELLLNLAV